MSDKNVKIDVDLTGVSDSPENKYPQKLKPGDYEFLISGVDFGETKNDKKTPYAEIIFMANDLIHKDTFYLTANALPRLKHLMINCGIPKENLETRLNAEQISKMLIGKTFHGILGGREFEKDGKIYVAPEFGFLKFAEPTGSNTLKFDASKNIKKLQTNPNKTEVVSESYMEAPVGGGKDDLPF